MSKPNTQDRTDTTQPGAAALPGEDPPNANDVPAQPTAADTQPRAAAPPARRPKAGATEVVARCSVRVTFADVIEWCGELAADADQVEDRVVRVTVRQEPPGTAHGMSRVDVIAGYVARGQVLEAIETAGTLWHDQGDTDRQTMDLCDRVLQRVNVVAGELGLSVRGGRFGPL